MTGLQLLLLDHVTYSPLKLRRGEIRQRVQIPLCRHRLR